MKRLQEFDILKCLLIICVVAGHHSVNCHLFNVKK